MSHLKKLESESRTAHRAAARADVQSILVKRISLLPIWISVFAIFNLSFVHPAFAQILRFALKSSGISYLRLDNIKHLVSWPFLPMLLALVIAFGHLIFWEYLILTRLAVQGRRQSFREVLKLSGSDLRRLWKRENIFFLLLLPLFDPANVYRSVTVLIHYLSVPKFAIDFLLSTQWIFVVVVLLNFALILFLARYCLVFHFFHLEGCGLAEALRRSSKATRRHYPRIVVFLLFLRALQFALQLFTGYAAHRYLKPIRFELLNSKISLFFWGGLRNVGSALDFLIVVLGLYLCWSYFANIYAQSRNEDLYVPGSRTHRRWQRIALFVLLIVSFCLRSYSLAFTQLGRSYELLFRPELKICGHRGEGFYAPENTLPAIELAIEKEADYVEIDVQLTSDDEIIVLHDKSFARVCGVDKRPSEMSFEEIRKMDAGSSFSPEFAGTPIASLREVLEACRNHTILNIELKPSGDDEKLADATAALVAEMGMNSEVIFSSSSRKALARIKEINPQLRTAYILSFAIGSLTVEEGIDIYVIETEMASEEVVQNLHEHGKEVFVWTVNDAESLATSYDVGADAVISDDILFCKAWIAKRELEREDMSMELERIIQKIQSPEATAVEPETSAEPSTSY
ncbi:MAG: glycerophosphodiester phosphodiesterase family protein [Eubacteriales bacterium]|nr:glycerophosphodiester phosphodiesterase family protein [Eubacteriales bacterium]